MEALFRIKDHAVLVIAEDTFMNFHFEFLKKYYPSLCDADILHFASLLYPNAIWDVHYSSL